MNLRCQNFPGIHIHKGRNQKFQGNGDGRIALIDTTYSAMPKPPQLQENSEGTPFIKILKTYP